MTDASGQVVARERYTAFGERRRGESPTTTDYLYTDQRYSASVGFYHYTSGAPGRHYDSLLGRFLQADPVTPGDGSQSLNRFTYVFNAPLTLTDPSGYDPLGAEWYYDFLHEHHRVPTWEDYLIQLFWWAYPHERRRSDFYDRNWNLKISLDDNGRPKWTRRLADFGWIPDSRDWNGLPNALEDLASKYEPWEHGLFVHDVLFAFSGRPSRFEGWSLYESVTDREFGQRYARIHIRIDGLPDFMRDGDIDSNVRHWGWSFALGYTFGGEVAIALNFVREYSQVWCGGMCFGRLNEADIELGTRGASMGGVLHNRVEYQCSTPYGPPCDDFRQIIGSMLREYILYAQP